MTDQQDADLCPCGETSPEGCADRPSRHCGAGHEWPGKIGVPLNPERDGWHWLRTPIGLAPYEWCGEWVLEEGVYDPTTECAYIAPVLTPTEVAALVEQARREGWEDRASECGRGSP